MAVDTTVQEKAIAHPTEHGLLLTAIEQLGAQAKKSGLRLRRLQRDIRRKMAAASGLAERQVQRLEIALAKAWRIAQQRRGDPGYLYSWHATEVGCISKGKARAPYEFGCKVSLATSLHPAKGGHFILHAQALHGNPYDGHTLALHWKTSARSWDARRSGWRSTKDIRVIASRCRTPRYTPPGRDGA